MLINFDITFIKKSRELTPEIGNLKKAFARQRAKDLAEHAKLLMNKEHEINNLKKEALQGSCNGFVDVSFNSKRNMHDLTEAATSKHENIVRNN